MEEDKKTAFFIEWEKHFQRASENITEEEINEQFANSVDKTMNNLCKDWAMMTSYDQLVLDETNKIDKLVLDETNKIDKSQQDSTTSVEHEEMIEKAAFTAELKKMLQRAAENITEETEEQFANYIDEAMENLCKDMTMMTSHNRNNKQIVPDETNKIDKSQEGSSSAATSSVEHEERIEKAALTAELKKKLQRVAENITEDTEEQFANSIDEAMKNRCEEMAMMTSHDQLVLDETKKIDKSQEGSSSAATTSVEHEGWMDVLPDEFKCPISGSLMVDPVTISTGWTYDKQHIVKWFEDGNRTCPKTDEKLTHTVTIPNNVVKKLILQWFEENNIQVPTTLSTDDDRCTVDTVNQEYLVTLLEKLDSSISDARGAVKELQTLTKRLPSVPALVCDDASGAITRLLSQILMNASNFCEELYEKLVATLLSISDHDSTKLLKEIPAAISFLVKCLSAKRIELRSKAAALVAKLSDVDSNRRVIGRLGAIKPLLELIKEGDPLALEDAVSAILRLCTLPANRKRAISEGAVAVTVRKLSDDILTDEMLRILTALCRHQTAIDQMVEQKSVHTLFRLLKNENVNGEQKESCVAILHAICFSDERNVTSIWKADVKGEIISRIATTGSERAKKMANEIMQRLNTSFIVFRMMI